ncbi:MAG: cation:proton antiporter [Pirellulales bacterium]|nr:cation:proton antiporter [Pirellulales bacterium]
MDLGLLWVLGILMAAALAAGGVGAVLRLPKVTSYLLMGVILGPSVLHVVSAEHAEQLQPLTELAIALVLFNLGCHFPLARARRIFRFVPRMSMGELGLTFLLVSGGVYVMGLSWPGALLLGALALATAPATTILVLKEYESEGPVTESAYAMVVVNNVIAIVLFEVLFLSIHALQGKLGEPFVNEIFFFARGLLYSIAMGILGGLAVSFCYGLVAESRRLVLLVATIIMLLGGCHLFDVPYLLTFVTMGVTVANTTYHGRQVNAELDRITGLLCVVFFATHGAELDLDALEKAGMIGAAYIVLRSMGKSFGPMLAGKKGHEEPAVRYWLGLALLSQAGVAITLSEMAVDRDPQLGKDLQAIVLGTVVVFEVIGPLLIRLSVTRTGEVPIAQAISHPTFDILDQIRTVWNRTLMAFGYDPWKNREAEEITVNEMMRKKVSTVSQSATFEEVVEAIEHSRDNTFPVTNNDGELMGVIRYRELSDVLFDPSIGSLVRAADLTTAAGRILYPDDTIDRACEIFSSRKDDCIPVLTREKPQVFLGLVRRRDILRMLFRGRAEGQGE